MTYELGSPVSDLLALNGALSEGSAGTYGFIFSGANSSQTYTLITFSNDSGFSASDFTGAPTGMEFDLTPTSLLLEPAPEPATFALLGLGGLMAGWQIRRRKA